MVKKLKKRTTIQTVLNSLLFFALFFSNYKPLIITAYLAIAYTFLNLFHYIAKKETERETNLNDMQQSEIETIEEHKHFWPQTITFVVFQLLSLLAVFGLTWYVLVKKLNVF